MKIKIIDTKWSDEILLVDEDNDTLLAKIDIQYGDPNYAKLRLKELLNGM